MAEGFFPNRELLPLARVASFVFARLFAMASHPDVRFGNSLLRDLQ